MTGNQENDNRNQYLPYMKLWADEWLGSSIHYNCSLEEQGFFVAIMALAAKNRKERGCLSLEKGQPMPLPAMASALYIDVETLERHLKTMMEQDRVGIRPDGVLYIKNFDYYQNRYRRSKYITKNNHDNPEAKEERERGYLHNLQAKYPDEIRQETLPIVVDKDTGEVIRGDKEGSHG